MATHSHRSGASGTASPPKRLAWGGVLAALLIVLALLASRVVQPAGASLRTPLVKLRSTVAATAPKPGQWVQLGPSLKTTEAGIPAIWVGPAPAHTAYILWLRQVASNKYTFEAVTMAPNGIVSSPRSIFGKAYWSLLTSSPQLVAHGSLPLLVFDGNQNNSLSDPYSKSCIVGALEGSPRWTLQHWSLSNHCTTIRSAIETRKGVLSASWANGDQVFYRIGISPTIPATGPDSTIKPSYAPFFTGQASDWATGDIYVAWTQQFSSGGKLDGYFVKDVTANAAIRKARET